ncbi:MAG: nitrogen fixation protein NifH [Chloroflexi bacterium]|nr:nitrogen fixation protein NifH [Chloroflexota bacterium]
MSWQTQLKGDSVMWLLEKDEPGVRYLALRDLKDVSGTDRELRAARKAAHQQGPIAAILDEMDKAGFWLEPGPGYNPKYRSTVWALIALAQLGASIEEDKRIALACAYFLDHAFAAGGQITASGAPSGTADCLQGNLCWALLELGYDDPRLATAFEWMARTVTGEGIAPVGDKQAAVRYYAGKCGPLFACGANNKLPCAWGGVKVMLALGKVPLKQRTPLMKRAIKQGAEFLLSVDPATATYPAGFSSKPSQSWWKFGFPVFYVTDVLQIVEALVALGYSHEPRLTNAITLVHNKQDDQGRWLMEYGYTGKTWGDFGRKKQPNKWVTLRALRALKAAA